LNNIFKAELLNSYATQSIGNVRMVSFILVVIVALFGN